MDLNIYIVLHQTLSNVILIFEGFNIQIILFFLYVL